MNPESLSGRSGIRRGQDGEAGREAGLFGGIGQTLADEQVDVAEGSKAVQAFSAEFTAVGEEDAFIRLC